MLQKDPEKRIELIDFVQSEYNIIDDYEFEQIYEKTKASFEENAEKQKKLEEEKENEKIIEKFNNMRADEKHNKHEYNPPPNRPSPRSSKKDSSNKPAKKKKVAK